MAKRGRPPEEVPERWAASIEEWISDGKTLRSWCRLPGRPKWRTVYHWTTKDPEFAARIARAREMGRDAMAEDAYDTLAEIKAGQIVTIEETPETDKDGKPIGTLITKKTVTEDMLGHRKLFVEGTLKLLAKWDPKKWGDRVALAGDKENPLVPELPQEQIADEVAKLLKDAADRKKRKKGK